MTHFSECTPAVKWHVTMSHIALSAACSDVREAGVDKAQFLTSPFTQQMKYEMRCGHSGGCTGHCGTIEEGQPLPCPRLEIGSDIRRGCLEEVLQELGLRVTETYLEVGDG